jgi:hypothetical protein
MNKIAPYDESFHKREETLMERKEFLMLPLCRFGYMPNNTSSLLLYSLPPSLPLLDLIVENVIIDIAMIIVIVIILIPTILQPFLHSQVEIASVVIAFVWHVLLQSPQ